MVNELFVSTRMGLLSVCVRIGAKGAKVAKALRVKGSVPNSTARFST